MQKLIIKGKKSLTGTVKISGSKNATLPILASTILSNNKITIKNVPLVKDVFTMIELLNFIGLNIQINKKDKSLKVKNLKNKLCSSLISINFCW